MAWEGKKDTMYMHVPFLHVWTLHTWSPASGCIPGASW